MPGLVIMNADLTWTTTKGAIEKKKKKVGKVKSSKAE